MKEQFLLRMPKNIKEKLKQYGNEKGLSINAIILTAIYEYLERKGQGKYGEFNRDKNK